MSSLLAHFAAQSIVVRGPCRNAPLAPVQAEKPVLVRDAAHDRQENRTPQTLAVGTP
jgi:hypothetical protein